MQIFSNYVTLKSVEGHLRNCNCSCPNSCCNLDFADAADRTVGSTDHNSVADVAAADHVVDGDFDSLEAQAVHKVGTQAFLVELEAVGPPVLQSPPPAAVPEAAAAVELVEILEVAEMGSGTWKDQTSLEQIPEVPEHP